MSEVGAITGYIDVAQLMLYLFWFFFAGLLLYLRNEDRREGYPLEQEDGTPMDHGLFQPGTKVFKMAHGPHQEAHSNPPDNRELALRKAFRGAGMPYEPTGDPLVDGVGPASYAMRADHPDLDVDGGVKLLPLRLAPDYFPAKTGVDPRGLLVFGADGMAAGKITDLWVDRSEYLLRYLEMELRDGEGTILIPSNLVKIVGENNLFARLSGFAPENPGVYVDSITAEQFAGVPRQFNPDQVTLLEEDKIMGYFGGGKLYATPERLGPLL